MVAVNGSRFWLALGLGLVASFLWLGDAFLWLWERGSAGESDIAARGPFLLAIFLPWIALIAGGLAIVAAVWRARAERRNVIVHVLAAIAATLIVGAALYSDPTVSFWRAAHVLRGPIGSSLGYPGLLVIDSVLAILAAWLVRSRLKPKP